MKIQRMAAMLAAGIIAIVATVTMVKGCGRADGSTTMQDCTCKCKCQEVRHEADGNKN